MSGYRAPTGLPEDWGLEVPKDYHPQLVIVQPRVGNDPPTVIAINGESRTAVPLTKLMIAKLLHEISREAVTELECK